MEKLKLLQKKLLEKNIPAVLITNKINIFYLTGFESSNVQILATPKQIYLFTDSRYAQIAKDICTKIKIKLIIPKLGLIAELKSLIKSSELYFEEENLLFQSYQRFKKALQPIQFKPLNNFVTDLRLQKNTEEIKLLQKAQEIAEKVFEQVKQQLKVGQTEKEIAWEIQKLSHEFGAEDISFPAIVAFNENSAIPHHQPTSKKLKRGDVVLIDMGVKYEGYCSDMTRMIFTKQPTAEQTKVYNTVLKAQLESIKAMQAGKTGKEIDKIARDIIDNAGYKNKFGHSLGHGIGLEVHEQPNLSPHSEIKIAENTVITNEPGIYLENNFGVRIEDMLLITGKKNLNLTKIDKQLKNCIVKI